MRSMSPNSSGSKRLNLGLSERDAIRLNELGMLTNASSQTEVIKRALLTYEALVERLAEGSQFYVRDADDEEPVPLNLLIDVQPRRPSLDLVRSEGEVVERKQGVGAAR